MISGLCKKKKTILFFFEIHTDLFTNKMKQMSGILFLPFFASFFFFFPQNNKEEEGEGTQRGWRLRAPPHGHKGVRDTVLFTLGVGSKFSIIKFEQKQLLEIKNTEERLNPPT